MTTWSTTDKSANVVVTAGDLTASTNSTAAGALRSNGSKPSGKYYFEIGWRSQVGGATGLGIATATAPLGTIGSNATGALVLYPTGTIWFNGANLSALGTLGTNPTICFAVDLTNSRMWLRVNGGNWNNSGTANPATNVGGYNIAALFPTNAVFACASFQSTTTTLAIINFGATALAFAVPSGFASWDVLAAIGTVQSAVTINTG